ncbi:unnamed protein product [Pedinophyceae sp. YPF-701]|nr:unnamed protein product [Pedinophyceae sp. YPF-701]
MRAGSATVASPLAGRKAGPVRSGARLPQAPRVPGRPPARLVLAHPDGAFAGAGGGVFSAPDQPAATDPAVVNILKSHPAAPRRICIFVEPTPFYYVCGYKNRFCNLIKFLRDMGCDVLVITTGRGVSGPGEPFEAGRDPPKEYYGAKCVGAYSFGLPLYWQLPLTFALSPRIFREVRAFNPDIIHCTSPGFMPFACWLYSRLLRVPLVMSYHTHLPAYLPKYNITFMMGVLWTLLRLVHSKACQLTLVTSPQMKKELDEQKVHPNIEVWKKGVDSDLFHPRFKSDAMRARLTAGHLGDFVMVYVGRLGHEKNLDALKHVLDALPHARLALVGDGPARRDLERHFRGTRTEFLGMLHGEDLSAAYASADLFVMPSESETLGFVVLEAMASGVPAVCVRAGGIPDIIAEEGDGGVGYLYDKGDIKGAIATIDKLSKDPALRERVGARARQEVSRWDWKAATEFLLTKQYPIAIAAAQAYWGPKYRKPLLSPVPGGSGDGSAGAPPVSPAPVPA